MPVIGRRLPCIALAIRLSGQRFVSTQIGAALLSPPAAKALMTHASNAESLKCGSVTCAVSETILEIAASSLRRISGVPEGVPFPVYFNVTCSPSLSGVSDVRLQPEPKL